MLGPDLRDYNSSESCLIQIHSNASLPLTVTMILCCNYFSLHATHYLQIHYFIESNMMMSVAVVQCIGLYYANPARMHLV